MAYECQAVPATEGSGANIRTVRIEKMLGNLVKDGLQLSRRMKKRDNVYHRRVLSMSGTWLTAEISSPGGILILITRLVIINEYFIDQQSHFYPLVTI